MDPETKSITDDDMERMAQAAIDQGDGGGPTNDVLPCGFPPLLALGLLQRVRRAEAIVRDLAECYRPADSDYGICSLCDANPCAPTCPYRRAVEATRP